MYLRFEVAEKDEVSGREKGLFQAMSKLQQSSSLYTYEIELEKEIYNWFKKNLKVPKVQASTSGYHSKPKAISWFKFIALEYISKMRQYSEILEAHDVKVTQIKTDRPGDIVYEDEFQIAAIAFNDTSK